MRTGVILLTGVMILLSIPVQIGADDPIPTNDLIIDERWIDIIQEDNRRSLDVTEYIFFNNTGTDTFNGTIYSWIPENAVVRSKCCGNAPDMACRMDEGGAMLCFDMVPSVTQNVLHGRPFEESTFMSYFGQEATISIEGTGQNSSYSDTLLLNVTVGLGQAFGDFPNVTGDGLHLTHNAEQLGVVATIPMDASGMATKLGLIQSINITNNYLSDDTVDLTVTGLPEGWTALFIEEGVVESTSVVSNESKEIILHIQVPTYKIEIQLAYSIGIEGSDDPEAEYLFQKELLYYNDFIEVFAFILEDDKMTVGDNLDLLFSQWHDQYKRMWYTLDGSNVTTGDTISFAVGWENQLDLSFVALAITLIVVFGLIGFLIYRKKYAREDKEVSTKVEEKEAIIDPSSELEEKKRTMLLAIKRLESDYKEGEIPKEVYDELLSQYKKSTIEVMKEIDGFK
jgi:hypothetical protein